MIISAIIISIITIGVIIVMEYPFRSGFDIPTNSFLVNKI